MADNQQQTPGPRSPRAVPTRWELYSGFFLIWLFLWFVFGELVRAESSLPRLLYWAVSFLLMVLHGVIVVGMWWVGRREQHED